MALITATLDGSIGTTGFDRDDKRNALSAGMIAEIIAALEDFTAQRARAVVLRSATSGHVWSAGHDVDELPNADVDPLPYSDALEQLLRAVKACPAPAIAMVHGSVWGGACDLAIACDLGYGDETAAFAITPAKLGLSRLPLNVVKEMFFSADLIPAERALQVGILNRLVPAGDLESTVYTMAHTLTTRSSAAIAAAKESIRLLTEAVPISPATFEYLHGLRRTVYFGPDYHEGTTAFREKRAPRF